jgi:hypothetical protein
MVAWWLMMTNPKLDREPYDRGRIAIHDDFESIDDEWFCNLAAYNDLEIYSEQSFRWHLSQAQESVDDIIWEMMSYE